MLILLGMLGCGGPPPDEKLSVTGADHAVLVTATSAGLRSVSQGVDPTAEKWTKVRKPDGSVVLTYQFTQEDPLRVLHSNVHVMNDEQGARVAVQAVKLASSLMFLKGLKDLGQRDGLISVGDEPGCNKLTMDGLPEGTEIVSCGVRQGTTAYHIAYGGPRLDPGAIDAMLEGPLEKLTSYTP